MLEHTSFPDLQSAEETRLLAFDAAWETSPEPAIPPFFNEHVSENYILEVIRIDVERRRFHNKPVTIEYYLKLIPGTKQSAEFVQKLNTIVERGVSVNSIQLKTEYLGLQPHARGGLGQIYLTIDQQLGRPVAVKILQEKWCRSENACKDFLDEARITSQLDHPGIAPIYQVGKTPEGRPCYSMRFIQGQTLREAIAGYHQLPNKQTTEAHMTFRRLLTHFVTVCQTIGYAHNRGILHQDIKPENIMLGSFGETVVLDWGLAHSSNAHDLHNEDAGKEATHSDYSSVIRGTLAYLSPEQTAGRSEQVTSASDIFGLGATLYTILCNQPPYQSSNKLESLHRAICADCPKPSDIKHQVPHSLEAVCLKAMSKLPVERYGSALELADEIDRYLADEPVTAWREPWTVRFRRSVRKRKPLFAVVASLALFVPAALAIGSWLILQEKTKVLLSEQHARLQEQSSQQITEYLAQLFESAAPLSNSGITAQSDEEHSSQHVARVFLDRGQALVSAHLKDHPLIRARLLFAMSRTHHSLGTYEEARRLAEESYRLQTECLDAEHPDATACLQLMGRIAQDSGEYQQARALYEKVLQIRLKQFGQDHLLVAETLYSLGSITFYQPFSSTHPQFIESSRKEAESFLMESLRIRRKLHVGLHPETGYTLAALASLKLSEPGQEWKALNYANEAMQHFEQSSSEKPFGSTLVKMIQAEHLRKARRFSEAEKIYLEVLAQMKKYLGSKHPLTILQMANLVGLVNASQDMDRALQLARELLEVIRPLAYFRSQPIVIERMIYFGDVLTNRGEKATALAGYEEALRYALERPADNHQYIQLLKARLQDK